MHIKGRPALLQKIVFELKYLHGFTYLDKCGRTINAITRQEKEWVLKTNPDPQTSALASVRNSATFNFSSSQLDLFLEKPGAGEPLTHPETEDFINQAEIISRIVIDQLGLNEFTRIGFRAWYLIGCDNSKDAEKWLLDLGVYKLDSKLTSAFNGKLEVTNFTAIIAGEDRKFRIALNGVENNAQIDLGSEILNIRASRLKENQNKMLIEQLKAKRRRAVNPSYAVLIDVDAAQEDPVSIDIRDFIKTSVQKIEKGLQSL